MITDGPWMASAPHPQTDAITIVNPHGRVIAAMVPNADDAAFICAARNDMADFTATIQIDWKAFGLAVQAARKAERFSQDELATATAISRNYISMIERGRATDPSYTIVLTLCRWLRLEMPQR
jgi:DNA-binding XRE family transcriptional regulator